MVRVSCVMSAVTLALLAKVSHDNKAYQKLYRLVYSATPDFMVLLEINNTWVRALQPLLNDYPHSQVKVVEKFGIALLSRIPFENAAIKIIGKAELPSVIARFNVKGQRFTLIGTHPHSPTDRTHAEYRNNQLADLAQFVSEQEDPIILLGDLNISPWSPIFKDFLRSAGLRDSREGFGLQASWPTWFPPAWIPIDHVLVSSNVTVNDRKIERDIGSDHYPVIVDFSVTASH